MPSSRKQRHSRRQKKALDAIPTSHSPPQYSSPSPHPYHDNVPPPPPPPSPPLPSEESFQQRNISDITMEQNSAFEYSDTSDDADAYFLPTESLRGSPSLLDNIDTTKNRFFSKTSAKSTLHDTSRRGRTRTASSGESAFRELEEKGTKSTKIVRFPRGRNAPANSDSSNFEEEDATEISPHLTTDSLHHTTDENETKGRPLFGRFMKHVVHAFNTPSGIQHKGYSKKIKKGRKQKGIKTQSYRIPYCH